VAVVDYGAGNTRSVLSALRRIGRPGVLTSSPEAVQEAEFVLLPGVGSAKSAMEHLEKTGVADAIRRRFHNDGPIVGICLGMQLACERSDEDGGVDGLALIDGAVRRIPEGRVPRLGWQLVEPLNEAFYFAHSYFADSPSATGFSDDLPAMVEFGSFIGVQFHPEKSGPAGLHLLEQCLSRV
jgi:glutamine amidotransferase